MIPYRSTAQQCYTLLPRGRCACRPETPLQTSQLHRAAPARARPTRTRPGAGGGAALTAGAPTPGWRLDEKTRRAGRQGVAAARAALAGAVRPGDDRQADAA